MPEAQEAVERRRAEQAKRIEDAGASLARTILQVTYENGHVSWPREVAIAQAKIEEAVMWALKALG